jgi:DNA-directed RNA polymerase specialized sigma24 family protein
MSHEINLQHLTVEELAQRCAQETYLYFNHKENDPQYCFDLFRRAIRNKDERALEVIIAQYQPLVAKWVDKWMDKHHDFQSTSEEAQDYVAQAFERFWISFTPAKFDRSQSLAAVLRYLQMCVNGAIMDGWRKYRRAQVEQDLGDEEQRSSEPEPLPEDLLQKDEFWQLIRKKSKDPKEYTIVYASFHLDLSPREILAEYQNDFSNIKEIYQYKANFLERLERDEEIRKLVYGND